MNHSFEEALLEAKAEAQEALNATQFQMSLLRKNKLVDAGAKGFIISSLVLQTFTVVEF